MQQAADIGQEHRGEDERHCSCESIFQLAGLAPHRAKGGKEKSRKSHCRLADVHRQETGNDGNEERQGNINLVSDTPQDNKVYCKVKAVDMKKTVNDMVQNRTSGIKSEMTERADDTDVT